MINLSIRFVERIRIEIEKFLNHVAAPIWYSQKSALITLHSKFGSELTFQKFYLRSSAGATGMGSKIYSYDIT